MCNYGTCFDINSYYHSINSYIIRISIRYFFILSSLLFSCSSTKVVHTLGKPYLNENTNLLITPIHGLDEFNSTKYFDILAKTLSEDFNTVQYLYSVEYELKQQGFTQQNIDSIGQSVEISNRTADILDSDYFLQIETLNFHQSDLIESDAHAPNSNITLFFKIVDLRNLSLKSGFQVSVTNIGLKDRDDTTWELSSIHLLISKCIKKGAKQIQKGLISHNSSTQ